MLDLLRKLVPVQSPSGHETPIADVLEELAKPYGEVSRDVMGNVIVHKPGNGERVMLASHMDSIGFIVTYIEKDGFVRVCTLGGVRLPYALGQRVLFSNGVIGVVCADANVEPQNATIDQIYIDTAGETVALGDTATFVGETLLSGDKLISPYLDNRAGCAILLKALMGLQNSDIDLYVVFTVQEEVGCRGAGPAAYAVMPDCAVTVDICGAGDLPCDPAKNPLKVGAGPVVTLMDRMAISHPAVAQRLMDAAKTAEIPYQPFVEVRGGTDTGTIAASRGGVPAACMSICARYVHTPNEMISLSDCEQCARILIQAFGA
jgi:endoglucanase